MFENVIKNVREEVPIIQCITNYVTVNDVANILLACGASPIMADVSEEADDMALVCSGLVINIGNLNKMTIEAMFKAGSATNKAGNITVLDPVGAGASTLRTNTTLELLEKVKFSVIRGNISEIKAVANKGGATKGVDADIRDVVTEENLDDSIKFAKELSKRTGAVIAITGAIDIVADSESAYVIRNGHPMMSKITGTGCMLTALISAFCASNSESILQAAAAAVCAEGLAGELAYKKTVSMNAGTSSFRMYLIDEMSKMTDKILEGGKKVEIR